jgi:hypothetical protein
MSRPMFPARFTLVSDDGAEVSIELHADGTWTGDRDAFLKAVAHAEDDGQPLDSMTLWLVVRALNGHGSVPL